MHDYVRDFGVRLTTVASYPTVINVYARRGSYARPQREDWYCSVAKRPFDEYHTPCLAAYSTRKPP
jgi:hypothetical protein